MKTAAFAMTMIAALAPMQARAVQSVSVAVAANGATVVAPPPAAQGAQSVPDVQGLSLASPGGYLPLQTSGGKCLLVARRGKEIVALELTPIKEGAKIVGWKPKKIDMDTLTSKWGYHPRESSLDTGKFSNPATSSMSAQTVTDTSRGSTYATASSWSNANVEAHSSVVASGEVQSSQTMTINGKTYRKYTHFTPATPGSSDAVSEEYICP